MRRWLMTEGGPFPSLSCDDPSKGPDLAERLARDLINDAATVDERFSEAMDGMPIERDMFGVEDEAEVI